MIELPATDRMRMRPIWVRVLLRSHGCDPGPISEDDERDAIRVLEHVYGLPLDQRWAWRDLQIEAERVLDIAGR